MRREMAWCNFFAVRDSTLPIFGGKGEILVAEPISSQIFITPLISKLADA